MADLTSIFSGGFRPPVERQPDPPEVQLIDAIADAGLMPPGDVVLDGRLHRFNSGTKGKGGGDKTGWYVAFSDGVPAGRFGCWRAGIEQTWRADIGRRFTPAEEMAHVSRMAEARAARDAELDRQRKATANVAEEIWVQAQAASPDHPYLKRKGVQPHGARITGDGRLIVPLYTPEGALSSLQYIGHDGGKLYHAGGQTGGCFWAVGDIYSAGPLYIAEGFATAATIHEATGQPCVAAYSASNLVPVTGSMREMLGAGRELVIVADNDASGVGQRYAEQAAAKHVARIVVPPMQGDANDFAQAGMDLNLLLNPPREDGWLIPADEFSAKPAPISWRIKNWLQDKALIMVHGPSGGGKTFVVLDMLLRIASGMADWMGKMAKPGAVVYLAGEGHHGLRGRIAAWKHHNGQDRLKAWLSKEGCDLNTPAGYIKVAEQVRQLPEPPAVIVVDTLHRFLLGDENSAQDAKGMLDACSALMQEFGCTVILVHHTGVSDEAQHRARGSSAWRGALDIEISVIPGKDGQPIQIVQRKSKDSELAEPIYACLEQVVIPEWFDEEGEPVTSAVLAPAEAPAAKKGDSKLDKNRKLFEQAWWASGAEERNGAPYVSRSGFMAYLTDNMGLSEVTAKVYIKPSQSGRPIADLMLGEIIKPFEHGWTVSDSVMGSAMLMRKNG